MAKDAASVACFGREIQLGDQRLDRRLMQTFDQMARRPGGSLPSKLPGRAALVGSYRLFNHAALEAQKILQAHRRQVLASLAGFSGKLLLVHDTTVLDYSGLSLATLGQIGEGHGRGLYAHHSLLVEPVTGQVLGLMGQILHVRDQVPAGETKAQRRGRRNRESRLWKQAVADLGPWPEGLPVIDVSDRGSDITEYLAYELAQGRRFVVRSQHDRVLLDPQGNRGENKLHAHLRALVPQGHQKVQARDAQGRLRTVEVALAWCTVQVQAPRQPRGEHGKSPLTLQALIVRERSAVAGSEPLEWMLLTNRPIESFAQAQEVAGDYACRYIIEDYHKAQKTGCGIEQLQLTTAHGLANAIAMLSVLAVWVHGLKTLARNAATAGEPAVKHVDSLYVQLAALQSRQPWETLTVKGFYVAVARLGGYQHHPDKKPPGWQTLWRGYVRLHDMAAGALLLQGRCVQS